MSDTTQVAGFRLFDLTETDYNMWRHHPVTMAYLDFLRDYREMLLKDTMSLWEGGTLKLADEQERRGRVLACSEMAELPFEAIRQFYEGEKESETEN